MKREPRTLRMSAALLVVLCLVPGMTGIPLAATAAPTELRQGAQQRVTETVKIVIKVANCGTCTLNLEQSYDVNASTRYYRSKKVVDGRAVFYVPRPKTRGLFLWVHDPGEVDTGARTVAVLRYTGLEPGQLVSPTYAANSTYAHACSRKIYADVKRWYLKVDHFSYSGGYANRPYLSPGIRVMDPRHQTWQGALGYNGDWPCLAA